MDEFGRRRTDSRFIERAGEAYQRRTGLTVECYVCSIGDGVREQDCGNKLVAEGE